MKINRFLLAANSSFAILTSGIVLIFVMSFFNNANARNFWDKMADVADALEKEEMTNTSNAEKHILSLGSSVTFLSPEGGNIIFSLTANKKLSYQNTSKSNIKFTSNVKIKVKYVNDDKEYSYEDSCTIDMQPRIFKDVKLSDVFSDISIAKEIEAIRIIFENSKIQIQ
ncbi:MAG: hypothetical protein LBC64_07795 [Fibromonadaceae bacterium]|jgi:hypothetical protein|nr:hypothetical protein [Fibromonadaceae bacterium]